MNDSVVALDAEAKALEAPADHKDELRLWLRLLTCANLVEATVRRRLRDSFDETLPRFDLMAQLDRAPDGMTLSELAQRMMVSNGNLTALVERLVEVGHLTRAPSPSDRRAQIVALTPGGRRAFRKMAGAHEDWIADMMSGLNAKDQADLMRALGKLKSSTRRAAEKDSGT
ncbi:MAG: MarR family transcriptional regulator [Rhizobiales bacterium 65-9]|nr:MarR family transcriptional regulator [Hyphomicrobiales bacterium]OJY37872.1 MAG: MarR family transcriptional regulator [Rhizobiales bacterium 65-9]